jgi:hypothetical protein
VEGKRRVPGLGPRVGEAQERGERKGSRPRPQTEKGGEGRKREGNDPLLMVSPRREKREEGRVQVLERGAMQR